MLIRLTRLIISKYYLRFQVIKYRPRIEISVSTDISILGFYRYIEYISEYFYMNIDISKINKNTLKFMEILSKCVKMTLIMKYTLKLHYNELLKSK